MGHTFGIELLADLLDVAHFNPIPPIQPGRGVSAARLR